VEGAADIGSLRGLRGRALECLLPCGTTVLGKDRHFDYAWTHGIHCFLALKPHPEDEKIGTMSPLLIEVLRGLLHMQAKCRASLGETCFHHERDRTCINHMEWMSQKEACDPALDNVRVETI